MSELRGRRREDTRRADFPSDVQVGDYWKTVDDDGRPLTPEAWTGSPEPTNLTRTCWIVACPGNDGGYLLANLVRHTVREHEDGTISVQPGDGSSNSILVSNRVTSWHGYIDHGVLKAC